MIGEKKNSMHDDTIFNNDGKSNNRVFESSKDLDKYGVWVKSDPYADSTPRDSSVLPLVKEDLLDDDTEQFKDTLKIADPLTERSAEDFIHMKDIEAIPLPQEQAGFTPNPVPVEDRSLNLHRDNSPPEPAVPDTSIQLLTKILEELSLIKEELSGFKESVLSSLSGKGSREISPQAYEVPREPEKIVLAGDELEDILNKADFIEDADMPMIGDISIDTVNFMEGGELTEEDLDFLKKDTFSNEDLFGVETSPKTSILPVNIGKESILEDPEKLQWLMKEGDKPLTEKTSEAEKANLLIDDLLIESGSIKDMPLDLDVEEDEEIEFFEEENLDLGNLETFDAEDSSLFKIPSFDKEPLEKIIFSDEDQDISDEELDKMEQDVLREFSNKLPIIEEMFFLEENKNYTSTSSQEGKKKLKNVTQPQESLNMPGAVLSNIREELKTVLSYMDHLLETLPDNKIGEFAESVHFDTYRKLYNELGLSPGGFR